jgi:hypothetical protein
MTPYIQISRKSKEVTMSNYSAEQSRGGHEEVILWLMK